LAIDVLDQPIDAHDRALGNAKDQEHGRGGVTRVVEPTVS